jgi:ESCRT-I complex subunit TSG101
MKVNPNHKHLDSNGQVYLPFLHLWSQNSHNLAQLGQQLTKAFSEEAPVHAVAAPAAPQQQTQPAVNWGRAPPRSSGGAAAHATVPNPYAFQSTHTPSYSHNPTTPTTNPSNPYGLPSGGGSAVHPNTQSLTSHPTMESKSVQRESSEESDALKEVMKRSLMDTHDHQLVSNLRELKRETEGRLMEPNQHRDALVHGAKKLVEIEGKLQGELIKVESSLHFYDQHLPALEESVTKLEATKARPLDIDAAVVASTPLYNQIMRLEAENVAIDGISMHLLRSMTPQTNLSDMLTLLRRKCYNRQFTVIRTLKKANDAAEAAE